MMQILQQMWKVKKKEKDISVIFSKNNLLLSNNLFERGSLTFIMKLPFSNLIKEM